MDRIKLPLVGAKLYHRRPGWWDEVPLFSGISYCEALRQAGERGEQWVAPDSIKNCRWSPVALGLKQPEADSNFENKIAPRPSRPTAGVYLARLDQFRGGVDPDVVIVRGQPEQLRELLALVERESLAWEHVAERGVSTSALASLYAETPAWRDRLSSAVNRGLYSLDRVPGWRGLTARLFRSRLVSAGFDQLIKRTMADMSMCRNSTVIPLLSGKVNASYFCTGGIAWGGNQPAMLTSGWPWELWRKVAERVEQG